MGRFIRHALFHCTVLLLCIPNGHASDYSDEVHEQVKAVLESLENVQAALERARAVELRQLPELIALGESGDVTAQLKLSQYYGRGHTKDSMEAMKWLRMAADQDNHLALWLMGSQYKIGEHVPQSNTSAIHWYKKSIEQKKDPTVMYSLAAVYDDEQDHALAVHWYERSADHGFKSAQLRLGEMYQQGLGVEADPDVACQWIRQAVENGAKAWHLKKAECE